MFTQRYTGIIVNGEFLEGWGGWGGQGDLSWHVSNLPMPNGDVKLDDS